MEGDGGTAGSVWVVGGGGSGRCGDNSGDKNTRGGGVKKSLCVGAEILEATLCFFFTFNFPKSDDRRKKCNVFEIKELNVAIYASFLSVSDMTVMKTSLSQISTTEIMAQMLLWI